MLSGFPKHPHRCTKRALQVAVVALLLSVSVLSIADAKSLTSQASSHQATKATVATAESKRTWFAWITDCPCWQRMFGADDASTRVAKATTQPIPRYGLKFENVASPKDPTQPLVVFIHGFNSTPERGKSLLLDRQEAEWDLATFAYPNDGPLDESAALLSACLKEVATAHPDKRIYLVTYSMGGLVARAAVENPRLAPGNVDRLIMVAPPSQGTLVAPYAVGTDLYEHGLARCTGSPWQRLRDSQLDGHGEATIDLTPGSEFLTRLNRYGRCSEVEYSLILGSTAPVSPEQMNRLRDQLSRCEDACRWSEETIGRLNDYLGEFDEIVAGRGDGVVAIKRGRISGVNDTIILPFGHLEVIDEGSAGVGPQVRKAILERLR